MSSRAQADSQSAKEGTHSSVSPSRLETAASALAYSATPHLPAGITAPGLIKPPPHPGLLGTIEQYELVKVLGRGGMGIVFLARDTAQSGNEVALKVLRPEYAADPRAQQRFLAEARHLHALSHPHLVPVLKVREVGGGAFFVMPYLPKGSLAHKLKAGVPLPTDEALRVAQQVASALHFAHNRGIIHHDLKPGNVLLREDGSVCLADFGLARTFFNDSFIDVTREQCEGTAAYMSPAVAAGQAEDTRCDIYGLGALLYEMLAGRPPYEGKSFADIRVQILNGPPKRIRGFNSKADPKLIQVAQWAMEPQHCERYASMGDALDDLNRVASGRAPLGPRSRARSLWRTIHQITTNNPTASWAMLGVILVASVGLAARQFTGTATRTPTSTAPTASEGFGFTLPWELSRADVAHWKQVQFAELNGLPGKEIIVPQTEGLLMLSGTGNFLRHWETPRDAPWLITGWSVSNINDDTNDEILVARANGTNLAADVVLANCFTHKRFESEGPPHHPTNNMPTGYLHGPCFVPASMARDGQSKMIWILQTVYFGGPRAVLCYDYTNTNLLWKCNFGPSPTKCDLLDLDGDGAPELLFGSNAPCNGIATADGTRDDVASVFALTLDGDRLWQANLAHGQSSAELVLADLDGDLHTEIICMVKVHEERHSPGRTSESRIVQLDVSGNVVNTFSNGNCFVSCIAADLNSDGRQEAYAVDCQGTLFQLGEGLATMNSRRVRTDVRRPGTADQIESRLDAGSMKAGNKKQILAHTWFVKQDAWRNYGRSGQPSDPYQVMRDEVILLDSELRPMGSYVAIPPKVPVAQQWHTVRCVDLDGDGLEEVAILGDTAKVLKLSGNLDFRAEH